ncbi:MAG TPA: hypothetical protein VHM00_09515 [Caldimonas sp.]|jgi:hypothetical protein|nr:hypothetical protein [Caldimonas sp.]HEX2541304.1 hypothetical protein [Caldimonas sp.]
MDRLVDRLRSRAAQHFVGRTTELALLDQSLAIDPPPVPVFVVHGPGGVGKTSLLERVRALAASHGIDSLRLDARDIEPTPPGVLRALGRAFGLAPENADVASVLASCAGTPRRLLLIDTFERIAHLEAWLRETVLAELPETTRVLIAGRSTPDAAWRTDPLWREGARVIGLRNLAADECASLLAARGIAAPCHERLIEISHGHPLALTLLADVVARSGEVPAELGRDVVRELAERFGAQAPTELHRRALEVCAHARVTTEALLADAVERERARELFDWLASLSVVESGPAGLFPHDLVRDAIDEELHWRHPERHREVHRAVRRHLIRGVADPTHFPKHTFDILFLHRHSPAMKPFVDFRALGSVYFEPGDASDLPALRELVAHEMPAAQHAAIERWWGHRATTPWVVRPAPGQLVAATLSIDLAALHEDERAADPVFAAVWRELRDVAPPRPGDRQLLARWNVADGGQLRPSAAMNGIQMSQFHQWLTLPNLGAFVICVEQPPHWAPMMKHIGFVRMASCDCVVDGRSLGCYLRDWRSAPIAPWLDGMGERELGREAPLDPARRVPEPQRLARPEFEKAVREGLRQLHQRTALAANPLVASTVVQAAAGDGEAPVDALRRLLVDAARSLAARSRDAKFWRALDLTYVHPAGSQELAAERLGLPFGTYRYQLATGIERVAQVLWDQETAHEAS